jgi:hypothetical protein
MCEKVTLLEQKEPLTSLVAVVEDSETAEAGVV